MIEYIIRDEEKEIHGTAEAVCLMTAGEPVEGEEDATAAGCIYYGPDRSIAMAEAFLSATLERQANVLRHIFNRINTKGIQDKDFCKKILKLSLEDLGTMLDQMTGNGRSEAATDPDFAEMMKNAGMWDGAHEQEEAHLDMGRPPRRNHHPERKREADHG